MPENPIVYCISEGLADDANFPRIKNDIVKKVEDAARCGVSMFQIREKKLTAAKLFELAHEAADAARSEGVKLLINGRTDIAMAAGADGVHLPSDGVPAGEIRRVAPKGFLIGVSAHSEAEVIAARDGGADFATFGPVFASPGKGEGVGVTALASAVRAAGTFPVLALGGVDEGSVVELLNNGAAGYAAIRYLNDVIASGRTAVAG